MQSQIQICWGGKTQGHLPSPAFFREEPESSGGEVRMELDARGLDPKPSYLPFVMGAPCV